MSFPVLGFDLLGLMATKRNLDIWYEGAVNSTGLHGRRPHIAFLSEAPIKNVATSFTTTSAELDSSFWITSHTYVFD